MTEPKGIFVFSGHMVDGPDRESERFPPRLVPTVRKRIGEILDHRKAGAAHLALCGGACGGDLIFAEEALARGLSLRLQLPFKEEAFLEQSVLFAGTEWVDVYRGVSGHDRAHIVITDPTPAGPTETDRFANNNLAMLKFIADSPAKEVHFIALWNGQTGDGPGGTAHMVREVIAQGGDSVIIDPGDL